LHPVVPKLVLAGRATDEAKPWLDRIARPPLAGSLRHIGYVDAGDRRALYEGARLLGEPAYDAGFGPPAAGGGGGRLATRASPCRCWRRCRRACRSSPPTAPPCPKCSAARACWSIPI